MTTAIGRAQELADQLNLIAANGGRYRASIDVKALRLPAILVHPLPARDYDLTSCSWRATYSIFALAPGPADLAAMQHLDAMAEVIEQLEGIESARPALYTLPAMSPDPLPAYEFTLDDTES